MNRSSVLSASLLWVMAVVLGCSADPDGAPVLSAQSDAQDSPVGDGGQLESAPTNCVPRAPTPAPGPSGYPLDGWSWTRGGVVLEDQGAASQDGYIAPAALVVNNTLHLWVSRKLGLQHRIVHTTSSDGQSFPAPEPTTGLEGGDIIAYPSVIHDGTRFLLWYGSGTIDFAESLDGVAWTMKGKGVLKPGEAGAFDSLTLLYPNVLSTAAGYVMYYTGFDGQAFSIGRAESTDGLAWDKSPSTAVLGRGEPTAFDNHAVAQPCAVVAGSRVLLWYGGYDTAKSNPGPYRIGFADSVDGKTFQRLGVTLDLASSGVEAWSTRDPAVVRWKSEWWMAYSAMGDDGRYRIAIATSNTCE